MKKKKILLVAFIIFLTIFGIVSKLNNEKEVISREKVVTLIMLGLILFIGNKSGIKARDKKKDNKKEEENTNIK